MFRQAYENILRQLEEMPRFIERVTAGLDESALGRMPTNDKSNLNEHLWHIRDCEIDLYALRIRRTLEEEQPYLAPVDVNAWPSEREYATRKAANGIAEFLEARRRLVAQLIALSEIQLSRVANRADGRSSNVLTLIEELAEHDRDHRWRIAAILRSFADETRVV